jgi:hypothetical protein
MQIELLNQAAELFDSPEKWYAYVEMANQKEALKNFYFQKVKQVLLKYFNEHPVKGWVCEPWGDAQCDLRWYLSNFGRKSLALAIAWRFEFHLHLEDLSGFDTNKMNELLKTEYSFLLAAFDRVDRQFEPNTKAMESRNYAFGSPYDFHFDNSQVDKLAWFAGNRTEEFAAQIIKKVERFRKDEHLTRMLYEVNERGR